MRIAENFSESFSNHPFSQILNSDMATQYSDKKETKKYILFGLVITVVVLLGASIYALLKSHPITELYGDYPDGTKIVALQAAFPTRPRPNFIIILCDDLGYGDLASYGGQAIRTPHIDRLAGSGLRFTDYYACNAVCAPSRAGLLTGRYPLRTGIIGNPYPKEDATMKKITRKLGSLTRPLGTMDIREDYVAEGLSPKEITLAEALKTAGYRTGMVGKWHLGDYSKNPDFNPLRHGFDSYFGVPHSNDMFPCPLYRNEKELEADIGLNQARLTEMYTREAIKFIEDSKDGPFFLYFAHTFPHQPLFASQKFKGKSKAGRFGDVVEEIDWSVGEIVSNLEALKLEGKTIVIFTSDNGPWYEGSPGIFRGRKGQSYEGGFRVPAIVSWPGKIPAGRISQAAVMNLDLYPTLLSLAGVALPEDRIIDGKNIEGLLSGEETDSPHEAIYFYHYDRLEGIRMGQWKYFRRINRYVWPVPLDAALVPHKMGKSQLGNRWPLLYDLSVDPSENYNTIDTYPEIAEKLHDRLVEWESDTRKNPRGLAMPYAADKQ
jgi:arylsulfatase A-like enzyme